MKLQYHIMMPNVDGDRRFPPIMMCLESLCQINEWHLKNRSFPDLYATGIFYKPDPPGREDWLDIPHAIERGWADCKTLACYLIAQYRHNGIKARPTIKWKYFPYDVLMAMGSEIAPPDGMYLVHVMCRMPNGSIECPSKRLGMKGEYT